MNHASSDFGEQKNCNEWLEICGETEAIKNLWLSENGKLVIKKL